MNDEEEAIATTQEEPARKKIRARFSFAPASASDRAERFHVSSEADDASSRSSRKVIFRVRGKREREGEKAWWQLLRKERTRARSVKKLKSRLLGSRAPSSRVIPRFHGERKRRTSARVITRDRESHVPGKFLRIPSVKRSAIRVESRWIAAIRHGPRGPCISFLLPRERERGVSHSIGTITISTTNQPRWNTLNYPKRVRHSCAGNLDGG